MKACRRIAILRGSVVPRSTQVYPPLKAVSRVTDKKLELLYPILILRIASAAFYLFKNSAHRERSILAFYSTIALPDSSQG